MDKGIFMHQLSVKMSSENIYDKLLWSGDENISRTRQYTGIKLI